MEHLKCANFSTLFLWRSVIPNVLTPKLTQIQTGSEYFLQANDMRMENIRELWKIFVKDIDIQIRLEAK